MEIQNLKKTCESCPSQWRGDLPDGRVIYIRYRWGILSVGTGTSIDQAVHNSWSHSKTCGACLDGTMETNEMLNHLKELMDRMPVVL